MGECKTSQKAWKSSKDHNHMQSVYNLYKISLLEKQYMT